MSSVSVAAAASSRMESPPRFFIKVVMIKIKRGTPLQSFTIFGS
ncbi:hypothetical protein A2U01_0046072, partial [Trifolium medium]|nr:hypothetical protein [Trifolium medium]